MSKINFFDPAVPDDTMVTGEQVATFLNVDLRTWLEWARKGIAPAAYALGSVKVLRWRVGDIRSYLENSRSAYLKQHNL